ARDRVIAEKSAAVLELFFDLVLARPSRALAVYGSLAPGGVHHHQLDSVVGEWVEGVVRGRLCDGPFPRLAPTPAAEGVSVQLLWNAHGLPDYWSQLDRLEGNDYRRVLVAVETEGEGLVIANLYAA
ncbi:MAG: gamma-glutamylcyclotransferase family protein, partial [Acidimicrobiales bacterium]